MVFPYIFVGIAQISGCFLWRGKSVDFEGFAANKVPIKSVKQAFFEPKMGQNSKSSTILFSRTFLPHTDLFYHSFLQNGNHYLRVREKS